MGATQTPLRFALEVPARRTEARCRLLMSSGLAPTRDRRGRRPHQCWNCGERARRRRPRIRRNAALPACAPGRLARAFPSFTCGPRTSSRTYGAPWPTAGASSSAALRRRGRSRRRRSGRNRSTRARPELPRDRRRSGSAVDVGAGQFGGETGSRSRGSSPPRTRQRGSIRVLPQNRALDPPHPLRTTGPLGFTVTRKSATRLPASGGEGISRAAGDEQTGEGDSQVPTPHTRSSRRAVGTRIPRA
jgi:hypothetical protein